MFKIKVVEKIKIRILWPVTLYEKHAVYKIISKETETSNGGVLYAGSVRLHARKHTPAPVHTQTYKSTRRNS